MSKPPVFSAVIIGLGNIGSKYDDLGPDAVVQTHRKALAIHPGYRLLGGVDIDPGSRKRFAEVSKTPAAASLDELVALTAVTPDVVVIAVPTEVSMEAIRSISTYPLAAILLEKPIATTQEEAHACLDFLKKNKTPVAVNYIRRWDPAIRRLQQVIQRGEFGEPLAIRCLYSKSLLSNGCHYVDLTHFLFGKEIKAKLYGDASTMPFDAGIDFALQYPTCEAHFHFLSASTYLLGEYDVVFESARITLRDPDGEFLYYQKKVSPVFPSTVTLQQQRWPVPTDMLRYQLNVVDGIYQSLKQGNTTFLSNGESALETLATCNTVVQERSNRTSI
jgi:predicted dehydrogenase